MKQITAEKFLKKITSDLESQLKKVSKENEKAYQASFIDEDSNSYDRAHYLSGYESALFGILSVLKARGEK